MTSQYGQSFGFILGTFDWKSIKAHYHVKDGRDQQLKFLDLAAQKGHIRALMTLAEQNPVKHPYWKQCLDRLQMPDHEGRYDW